MIHNDSTKHCTKAVTKDIHTSAQLASWWAPDKHRFESTQEVASFSQEVRTVEPVSAAKHRLHTWHRTAPRPDKPRTRAVLDFPLPRLVDATPHRCRICEKKPTFRVNDKDLKAAVPGLLKFTAHRQKPVYMTQRWLLQEIQLFFDKLCAQQVRRATVDQYTANSLALASGLRGFQYIEAVPPCAVLRPLLCRALLTFLEDAVRHMQRHINVYCGSIIRGDGNYELANRIIDKDKKHPFTVILAWVGIDGALLRPVSPHPREDWPCISKDLGDMLDENKKDRLEAGMSLIECAPVAHATDSFGKHRLLLRELYKDKYCELGTKTESLTPKADALAATPRDYPCPTIVTGDPLHDCLGLRRVVSSTSPDAARLVRDHQDIMKRLSQLPLKRKKTQYPKPGELKTDAGQNLLKIAVAQSSADLEAAMLNDQTAKKEVEKFLEQPFARRSRTWRLLFRARPPRGTLAALAKKFGATLHETEQNHGFRTKKAFKKEVRVLISWFKPGRKTSRRKRGIIRDAKKPHRVKGKRTAYTRTVARHLRRLLRPLKLEGLWAWHTIAMEIGKAKLPLQTGTVAVERLWASLKDMMPNAARHMSPRWFRVMSLIMFIRCNYRHFNGRFLPTWCQRDSLLAQKIQNYAMLAQALEDQTHLKQLFEAFAVE